MVRTAEFTKTFTLALPVNTYDHIKAISDVEGCSMGAVFREIIRQHFENESDESNDDNKK